MIHPALEWPLLGTMAIGAVAGLVGTFAVVRRQSLQGDAISHAALPGVGLAYLLGGRSAEAIALGAAVVGWLAMLAVSGITRRSRLSFDVALGGTLTVFFGLGLAILDYLKSHGASNHGLDRYLFGQAAMIGAADVRAILAAGLLVIAVMLLFWKQLKVCAFDPDYAASLGVRVTIMDALLTALLVTAVVIGLQAVGVILMSALLVAPAVAARQWTDRLAPLTILASMLGALGAAAGTLASHEYGLPTGPVIVLSVTVIVLLSLVPRRRLA